MRSKTYRTYHTPEHEIDLMFLLLFYIMQYIKVSIQYVFRTGKASAEFLVIHNNVLHTQSINICADL